MIYLGEIEPKMFLPASPLTICQALGSQGAATKLRQINTSLATIKPKISSIYQSSCQWGIPSSRK